MPATPSAKPAEKYGLSSRPTKERTRLVSELTEEEGVDEANALLVDEGAQFFFLWTVTTSPPNLRF